MEMFVGSSPTLVFVYICWVFIKKYFRNDGVAYIS